MAVRLSFERIDGTRGPVFRGDEAAEVGGHVYVSRDGYTHEVAVRCPDGDYFIASGADTGSLWGRYRRADDPVEPVTPVPVISVDQDSMDPDELAAIERRAGLELDLSSPRRRFVRAMRLTR
jgi:hypothetical protein